MISQACASSNWRSLPALEAELADGLGVFHGAGMRVAFLALYSPPLKTASPRGGPIHWASRQQPPPARGWCVPSSAASAREYFRIWIVNLLFTLLTLGVYSAWAKVRKQRYLYGNTRLDGDSFNYFASARAILKGRILAVIVFFAYAMLTELYPLSLWAFLAAGMLLLPLILVRALRFNARMSAWRGLRFDFPARVRDALPLYLGMPLLVVATLGVRSPGSSRNTSSS